MENSLINFEVLILRVVPISNESIMLYYNVTSDPGPSVSSS